jgi:hypothetical protein
MDRRVFHDDLARSSNASHLMHRTLPRVAGPYRVVFSSQAWKEIGLMPTGGFDALRLAVEDLADRCSRLNARPSAQPVRLSFTVDGRTVLYERDDAARTLTLMEIHQPSTGSP